MILPLSSNANIKGNSSYWLCLMLGNGLDGVDLSKKLKEATSIEWVSANGFITADLGADWVKHWNLVKDSLPGLNAANQKLALIPSNSIPRYEEAAVSAREPLEIARIADNYWLINYLENDKIECHFQSVVDKNRDVFGWESFARIQTETGELLSGYKIIEASKALNIKHLIDRHLHVQAVRDFAEYDLKGCLFINFIPDFIQRPEKYLEGLEDAARRYGVLTRRLILEFPVGDKNLNFNHIKSVADFCRSKGFQISLDDITNLSGCEEHINNYSPDFIKLDRTLASVAQHRSKEISQLVSYAHMKNCMALAEGIEEHTTFEQLKSLGVDLFQGYFFSRPERPKKR